MTIAMKDLLLHLLLSSLLCATSAKHLTGQGLSVGFVKPTDKLERPKDRDLLLQYEIKAGGLTAGKVYKVVVVADYGRTTYSPSGYSLDQPGAQFTASGSDHTFSFYMKLHKDMEADRERLLVLQLRVDEAGTDMTANNMGTYKQMDITIDASTPLEGYRFLAYVGTNFDLVDGVKARNLFFATNVYLPNKRSENIGSSGAYISLYGNRPVSLIDSSGRVSRIVRVETSSDSTHTNYYEKAERTTVFTSDNLGAFFSPLINLGKVSKYDNELALYFAPSAEFIFRRTKRSTIYTDGVPSDTVPDLVGGRQSIDMPDTYRSESNTYEFRYGLGFMLAHEGKEMSVRLSASIGSSSLYFPLVPVSVDVGTTPYGRVSGGLSFSGRLWITHRVSGLTVQAEVLNSLGRPRPFYGVTLSKAIDFKDLGGVFKPLARE